MTTKTQKLEDRIALYSFIGFAAITFGLQYKYDVFGKMFDKWMDQTEQSLHIPYGHTPTYNADGSIYSVLPLEDRQNDYETKD